MSLDVKLWSTISFWWEDYDVLIARSKAGSLIEIAGGCVEGKIVQYGGRSCVSVDSYNEVVTCCVPDVRHDRCMGASSARRGGA